jgi:hypothetical protein
LQGIIGVEHARFAGYNWSFYPPCSPYSFPHPQTYLPANSEGTSYSARSEQLPPASPAISYRPQSGNLWSTLPRGITLPMPWPIWSPGGTDRQRESVAPALSDSEHSISLWLSYLRRCCQEACRLSRAGIGGDCNYSWAYFISYDQLTWRHPAK